MGTNELIIFGWWYGMTAEDAIVRNADSVMRGAARVSVWRTQRAVAGRADSFEHPLALARDPETGRVLAEGEPGWEPPTALLRGGTDYSKIGADGAPLNGVFVRDGDVVLGRVARLVTLDPATGLERVTRLDRSIIFHCHPSETYVVDRVVVTNTVDGAPLVRVRMVATRAQGIGDKSESPMWSGHPAHAPPSFARPHPPSPQPRRDTARRARSACSCGSGTCPSSRAAAGTAPCPTSSSTYARSTAEWCVAARSGRTASCSMTAPLLLLYPCRRSDNS